ncbi:MAG: hypothetical protein GY786_08420 [Proteobacteria bacterium]|nr:hypothetical protein [Pseudomonadota bacterium]
MSKSVIFIVQSNLPTFFVLLLLFTGCNYNYHRGLELEKSGKFEDANIEFQRAYTQSPDDGEFRAAYLRTAKLTSADLMLRYQRFLKAKKFDLAFRKLEQAHALTPGDSLIRSEKKKWFHILIAGKVDFQFKSLRKQIPLTDRMELQILFNTPDPAKRLVAKIDNQTQTFSVEEALYEPPQNLLMSYTVNSIGVRLAGNYAGFSSGRSMSNGRLQKFIDFRTPLLTGVEGSLELHENGLVAIEKRFPYELISKSNSDKFQVPRRGERYSINLVDGKVVVQNSGNSINFLPQMLYVNKVNQRIFLDFGNLQLFQGKGSRIWSYRRLVRKERTYLQDLEKKLLLNPFFYFREGAFPFVKAES